MNFHLLPEERLRVLQTNDPRRRWYSLDDQRVCVLCGRTINGRQIVVTRESAGQYSLHCPTKGCEALPSDWFYQGSACATPNVTVRTSEASIWSA
jgi:hypothetical protein